MQCGISTACLFPLDTIESLKRLADTGARVTEIFLNTFSEMEDGYLAKLQDVLQANSIRAAALHPFSSMLEAFFFATPYPARWQDGLKLYRRLFEAASILGADKLVFHGPNKSFSGMTPAAYADMFCALAEEGQKQGVALCQENVSYCHMGSPAYLREALPKMGGHASFVLDNKQVLRQGAALEDMLQAMGGHICHVHISDHAPGRDCLLPGEGSWDFAPFLQALGRLPTPPDMVIEVYSGAVGGQADLQRSLQYINGLLRENAPAG